MFQLQKSTFLSRRATLVPDSLISRKKGKIDSLVDIIFFLLIVINIVPVIAGYGRFFTVGAIFVVLYVLSFKHKHGLFRFSYFTELCPLIINSFGLYILISAGWALNAGNSFYMFGQYEKNAILITVLYAYYRTQGDSLERIRKMIEYSGVVIVFVYIFFVGIDQLRGFAEEGRRMQVTDGESSEFLMGINLLASVLLYVSSYLLTSLVTSGFKIRHLILVPLYVLVFLTGSRKGLVGIWLTFLVIGIFSVVKLRKIKQYLFLVLISLFFFVVFSLFNDLGITNVSNERMEGLAEMSDASTTSRINMVQLGWKIFLKNPLVGCGMNCPKVVNNQVNGMNCYLHNDIAEILAGGGVVGFFLYYSIFVVIGIKFWKNIWNRRSKVPVPSFIACFMIFTLFLLFKFGAVTYFGTEAMLFCLPVFLCYSMLTPQSMVPEEVS